MRIKFLVFLAVFCLTASFVASNDVKVTEKVERSRDVKKERSVSHSVDHDRKEFRNTRYNNEGKRVDEKITVTRNRNEKEVRDRTKVKETEKKTRRTEIREQCPETIRQHRESCERKCVKGFKPRFSFVDKDDVCEWKCDYDPIPVVTKAPEKKVVTVKKQKPLKKRKECSGERKFKFQNCLVKLTGLMAWGDKTRNFDQKFARLVNERKKKRPAGAARK